MLGPDYYIEGNEMTLNEVKSTHGGVVQCNVEKSSTEEEISSSAYFVVFSKLFDVFTNFQSLM